MKKVQLNIKKKNGYKLRANLSLPAHGEPTHFALFAHCFTCNSNFRAVKSISRELTNHGFGVVTFDFTGLGMSEGDFSETNFSANIQDLTEVCQFIDDNYKAPSLLIGHSLGGAAVLVAGEMLDSVEAIVTIGAPSVASHVKHLFEENLEEIHAEGSAQVSIGGRPFLVKKQFVEDLENHSLEEVVSNLRKPLLFFHSPQDTIVEIENAANLYQWAFHPKSFVTLDGADHLLSKSSDGIYVARVIGSWVERYMKVKSEEEVLSTQGHQVAAHLDLGDGFTTTLSNGRTTFLADEPESVGGADLGFSPYELLMSSLGACTTMTLKMYADRKKWDLKEVTVFMNYSKRHFEDMESDKSKKVDHIEKVIHLEGDLSSEQKERLLEISERCPVHKTLSSDIRLASRLGV